MSTNGRSDSTTPHSAANKQDYPHRAHEAEDLLDAVKGLVVQFIRSADQDAISKSAVRRPDDRSRTALVEHHPPKKLQQLLEFSLPNEGLGRDGLLDLVRHVLRFSVNTWDQGFLDKLYASTTPVGLAAELLVAALNTNVHVYQVSPALTLIEKETARSLAAMFGFHGPFAGGVSQPGGTAANHSSIVIARNNLFPETKTEGNGNKRFVLFTSVHGHYSVEKAAQMFGFGSNAVRKIAVDERGRMRPDSLDVAITRAKDIGETPFYVNATAGTTVLGSFDPLDEIATVCRKHGLWMHVDGSWGAPVVFSNRQRHKLQGIERADSIATCPHKMMGVPVTCSFLLGKDLRQFHKGMTLPAGYLFHNSDESETNGVDQTKPETEAFWDLADLVPQCGRRGDSLKLALSWIYHGAAGFQAYVDRAFEMAAHLASLVIANPRFTLLSENPPPCLQVCFYLDKREGADENSRITEEASRALISRGFMIDHAPGEDGKFFRVVVNGQTMKETVEGLVAAMEDMRPGAVQ